ncbi:LptA/OstA family protein [Sporomusa sp.]|uniref:LptA/OstA family protein n=1 Tax=Sporomusa sp. TaxID=2078658 RepID=UPI002B7634FA|nr:LptA/OstA family protein [Sporomusa sp.]HWR43892.1 LptA/OstA family protein [Sporomusa sp.]
MKYNKIFLSTLLIFILLTGVASAAKPIITADRTYFDINSGLYILNGNVYIEVRDRVIMAGQARVNPTTMEVWGTGGISVQQRDINFTGDSVYIYGSKAQAKIDGGVNLSRSGLSINADNVDFNWRTRVAVFNGNVQVSQGSNNWSADSVSYNVDSNSFL